MNRKKSELLCGVREPNKSCSENVLVAMSRCWLGLEDQGSFTRQILHKKGTKELGKKTRDTYNIAAWFYTAFHDASLLFIHIIPSLLLFGICFSETLHLPVAPESVAGTTAPARAETSQLGGPVFFALQLGFLLTGQGTLRSCNTRKRASFTFHFMTGFTSGVLFLFVPFVHQKDRPTFFECSVEWYHPKITWKKHIHPHFLASRIFRTIKPSGRSREQR